MNFDAETTPLAISIGEPAGISADILLKLANGPHQQTVPPFFALADADHLQNRANLLGISIKIEIIAKSDLSNPLPENTIAVLPLDNALKAKPSEPLASDGAGVVEAITKGVELVQHGIASGLVTLPINKKSLYDAGFDYPGHTEYLGALAQEWPDVSATLRPVMMLAGPALRAVPVTIHIPLAEVPKALTQKDIMETTRIVHHDLRHRFGLKTPRIALSGLNPHAGEQGAMGREDEMIIRPAIEQLQSEGIDCFGPLPADTMFHANARETYDTAICMYHDQALIPAKALAFDETVNVTLGLPFIRTSPDHGTAFDIAGTGKANTTSTLCALQMAAEMAYRSQSKDAS